MRYIYSVVRFVPNPTRGECINLGLLLGSDETGEWSLELVPKKERARRIDEEQVLPSAVEELERLAGILGRVTESRDFLIPPAEDLPDVTEAWLVELAHESRNVIQYSWPQPVLAESLSDAVEKLWPLLVVERQAGKRQAVTKQSIISRVKRSLLVKHVKSEYIRQPAMLVTRRSHTPIDIAVHNGGAVHLTQCWSFQVQNKEQLLTDVKSWAWTIRDLRLNGGRVVGAGNPLDVRPNVPIGVVYAPPSDGDKPEMDEAINAFTDEQVGATHVEWGDVERIADAAAACLGTGEEDDTFRLRP